jgi:Uri superfamily endonuclease
VKITAIAGASGTVELKALSSPGCYTLVIGFAKRRTLRIGQRRNIEFFPGTYVYTGSAMSGLGRRLTRHLARRKKLRWHIDYLLGSPAARIKAILTFAPAPGQECRRNQFVARLPGAQIIMRKFGASDCRAGCDAHLYFFPTAQAPARIIAALKRHSTGHLRIRTDTETQLKNPL